jgi:hypothetical protein
MESLARVNLCVHSETAKVEKPLDQCVNISDYGFCGASWSSVALYFPNKRCGKIPFVVRRSKGE